MSPGILVSPRSHQLMMTTHHGLADTTPSSDQIIPFTIGSSPGTLLQPPPSLESAILLYAKRLLDPLAEEASQQQTARLKATRKKRKRGEIDDHEARDVLRLKQVHLEGFGQEQVWEQARRVVGANTKELARSLESTLRHGDTSSNRNSAKLHGDAKPAKSVRFDGELDDHESSEDEEEDLDIDNEAVGDAELSENMEEGIDEDMEGVDEEEFENIEEESDLDLEEDDTNGPAEEFVKDRHGLNDGFFSIDDFNRQTEFLEGQDAKGDPDDGAASDEEDIDWAIDPMSRPLPKNATKLGGNDDGDELSDEEDGPTFGNADLNAPWSDDDDKDIDPDDMDVGDDPMSNTNDIRYAEFFAPPARPAGKSKRKNKIQASNHVEQPTNDDIQRTIKSVRRDIFEDDDVSNVSDADNPEANHPSLSTHERRQAAIAAQIRELEAAAVAKREWVLAGEARAQERPLNSLLEEDLEFERTGKPVPVITAEVSASIEDMIKARILARDFNEVQKRRPGADVLSAPERRRGLVEIDDQQAKQGLAEVYEEEHLKNTDPGYVDKRDEKLKATHAEIERLWKNVSSKLDALTSFTHRPKPADVSVSVVSKAPRITMEDARPSGVGVGAEEGGLAPQEMYKPSEDTAEKSDVVTKGGGILNKEELTREEKVRRRRREKERQKKRAEGEGGRKVEGKATKEKKDIIGDLRKGGVNVIGKDGQVVDVEGRKKRGVRGEGAGGFKL